MISIRTAKEMALSLPKVVEQPHFEKTSFRVNKKIFATLDVKQHLVCVKLSDIGQSVFCAYDLEIIFPVPNKWGKQGWTLINLKKVKLELFQDVLTTAYCHVAPIKLANQVMK